MPQYNDELIRKNIEKFKSKHYKPEELTICFDMDNTLCLFSPLGSREVLNQMYTRGFFKERYCFPEALPVILNLQRMGFTVKILSACVESPFCKPEKLEWIHYHLPTIKDKDIIFCNTGDDKSKFIPNPEKTILVDDYHKNLQQFYEAGGIGVKKTYSGKPRTIPQVESLIDIFGILHDLNCFN